MSRFLLFIVFAAAMGAPPARAQSARLLDVTLDQATIAKLPAGATTVIVGNPMIADVTMLKQGAAMVLTGKGYGQTNLIALDAAGAVLLDEQLRVLPPRTVVVLQNGAARVSYACNPDCMPTVQLGDDADVFNKAGTQLTTRNGYAQGSATAPQPGGGR